MNDQQERFCLEYVLDYNMTAAAIRAGYAEASARQQASRLMTKDDIRARVVELGRVTAEEIGITKRYLLTRLRQSVEDNWERNPGASNRALELLMKHTGNLTDRIEHTVITKSLIEQEVERLEMELADRR